MSPTPMTHFATRRWIATILPGLLAAACATGQGGATARPPSPLSVVTASIRPAPEGQFETWAYVTIRNDGPADALVGATSPDAGSIVLRGTRVMDAGRQVRSVASIAVPAHATLAMGADTTFLAFITARHAYVPGANVHATLRFASGAALEVDLRVGANEGDPADAGN